MKADLELGVIGNCQISALSALIDAQGRYVWACMPRMDGDPVFCSLRRHDTATDEQGFSSVELQGCDRMEQYHEPNTAVLQTLLGNANGARVRIIEQIAGHAVLRVRLRPSQNYGQQRPERHLGSNHVRFEADSMRWRFSTDMSLSAVLEERPVVLRERICCVLGADESLTESLGALCGRFLDETRRYWRDWTRELAIPFEWQAAVIRAAITLKLCTYEDTGAVMAALTTSIPEAAGAQRNWDCRFCWLRDSYFTTHALNRLGATRAMEGYLRYVANVFAESGSSALQPVYGISDHIELTETFAPGLPGYRGTGPVRIGNQAYEQIQHDVYGAIILAAMQSFFDLRLTNHADASVFQQLEPAGERCWQCYDQPDAGIWEYRGRARVHSFSSVMCWTGVDRLARTRRSNACAHHGCGLGCATANLHRSLARPLVRCQHAAVRRTGLRHRRRSEVHRHGRASGPAFAARSVSQRRIAHDDFGAPENAFNICTFWYNNALAAIGRRDEARVLFDNMLKQRNKLGLLSEDLGPVTGELWGNYPQTYSLVGIINSAMRLSVSWEEAL